MTVLGRIMPYFSFLSWAKELKYWPNLRRDLIAGLTVALLLIPQALAYAQVAGVPAYYGLYAAFLPPMIAGLFGSSRYLSTGPVAITSLLTASVLQTMAVAGSTQYISYVIALTFLSGLIQCGLGMLRLGRVMNFISYPVMIGFTNAAAIIIAMAQLGSLIGIDTLPSSRVIETFWQVVRDIPNMANYASIMLGLFAMALLILGQYFLPRWPIVLLVVILTVLIAWATHYEKVSSVNYDQISSDSLLPLVQRRATFPENYAQLLAQLDGVQKQLNKQRKSGNLSPDRMAALVNELSQAKWRLQQRIVQDNLDKVTLSRMRLRQINTGTGSKYYAEEKILPANHFQGRIWHIKDYYHDHVTIRAGGQVVGEVPRGLPSLKAISIDGRIFNRLLMGALAIALIGFMESASVAKRFATDKRDLLNMNQELIAQGLAKIVGSFFQSMPVSGALARTALNVRSGARTNFSNIVAGLFVGFILLWGTWIFYYLPKATLAAIIMVSVAGLVNIRGMLAIFQVSRNEGMLSVFTFLSTLLLAPRIDYAILLGVLVSLVIYLNEGMKPRFIELVRQ